MPTITPQGRPTIGGSPGEYQMPRATLRAATGMNMPSLSTTAPTLPVTAPVKSGQSDTIEETAAPSVTLSPQLTALSRKQQALQREIAAFKAEKAEWESKQGDYVQKSAFKAKFQSNSDEALQELGTDYEELTRLKLAQLQGADPIQELKSEIESLKKSQDDNVNKQYDATLKQYRAEADALIAADPRVYHLINKGGHQDAIVQHIVETWQENPEKVLTVEQAAKEIEEVLRENAKAYADALKELEPPVEEKPVQKTLPPPKRPEARTLTQSVETVPTRTYGQFQHLSMKERIAQAAARAQQR